MSPLALARSPVRLPPIAARNPLLSAYGSALFILAAPTAMMIAIDPALLPNGVSPWLKPVKFLISTGVFALTAAWLSGYVRADRRNGPLLRTTSWVLIVSASFELVWILWQAAHGADSHFNFSTPLTTRMFSLMGLFAVALTATTLPLAWSIAQAPAVDITSDFRAAVVVGLVLTFLLGTSAGIAMGASGSHAVGLEGASLPLLGWNRLGGDLRVPHFLGIHAEQIIPAGAALIAGLAPRPRRWLLVGGIGLYVTVTVGVFAQALAGRPLIPA